MHMQKNWAALYAITAATLFGASAPLAKLLLADMHPVFLAALLYLGSGLGLLIVGEMPALWRKAKGSEPGLKRADLPWLVGATLCGGVAAPVVLLYGLKYTPAATASLILNFESAATAVIAFVLFREAVGGRVWAAVAAVTAAVLMLSLDAKGGWGLSAGALGVAAACILWGLDNNMTRNISAKNPVKIVIVKGIAAGLVNATIYFGFFGNGLPGFVQTLLACLLGLFCYGFSIVLFILAMRGLGSARTGAYFAAAPFIGAALSFAIFREVPNAVFPFALALMVLGVWLLLTEKHGHLHTHFEAEHEHKHEHGDRHHQHVHDGAENGEVHSHPHKHEKLTHEHEHTPDIHHRHGHEA